MVEKTLILKQISGMLCLLNSYSKFTRPKIFMLLKCRKDVDIMGKNTLNKAFEWREA